MVCTGHGSWWLVERMGQNHGRVAGPHLTRAVGLASKTKEMWRRGVRIGLLCLMGQQGKLRGSCLLRNY